MQLRRHALGCRRDTLDNRDLMFAAVPIVHLPAAPRCAATCRRCWIKGNWAAALPMAW